MFEATLSIDLGASYTKIARRSRLPDDSGVLQEAAKVLMVDNNPSNSPLIPSLAVWTRSARQPWVFGWEAAKMNPTPDMQVFRNWKADLFRPHNDKDSATAVIVAHNFFVWLRAKLEAAGVDLKKCQTRIAMPAFETFDEKAGIIARCMDLSGWDDPSLILKVREPHANTIGLFSKGRNLVSQNGETPNYGSIFGQDNPYTQAARGHTLFGTHTNLVTVAVVDIGAFTTDIAALTFDVTRSADGLSAIRQESFAVGVINELDRLLFAALAKRHGFSWSGIRFEESEQVKRRLYHGEVYPLLTKADGEDLNVQLGGDATDASLINDHTQQFAASVWDKIAPFIQNHHPEKVFLTGGGSLIPRVAEKLQNELSLLGISVGAVEGGIEPTESARWLLWRQTGDGLQRLATAVGGASVILQHGSERVHDTSASPVRREPIILEQTGAITCRCQGGHKDCCFCNGRGEIMPPLR